MLESQFQAALIKELRVLFPGCVILKNDANYFPGIPDLLILFGDRWATLEVKRSETAKVRPNQAYYVDQMNAMSFSSFIYPENREQVLDDLQSALRP